MSLYGYSSNYLDKVLFNDIYQIFMSFCMLCMVAFCQSVLLKRDDDDDEWTVRQGERSMPASERCQLL